MTMPNTIRGLLPDGTLPTAAEQQVRSLIQTEAPPPDLSAYPTTGQVEGMIADAIPTIPIFATLAEAEAWEAANPGNTAVSLEELEAASGVVFSEERPVVPTGGSVLWFSGVKHEAEDPTPDPDPEPEPPVGAVIAYDSFSRANGPLGTTEQGSKVWVQAAGDHAIQSEQAQCIGGGNAYAVVDAGTTDVEVTATLTAVKADNKPIVGLAARYVDANTHLSVQVRDGRVIRVWERTGGTMSSPLTDATTIEVGDSFGMRVIGTSVSLLHNGVVVDTKTTTRLDGNLVGLYGHGTDTESALDDFTARGA